MIKVFKGGYEVAQEYYFNYESYGSDIYDSETRIITGLLSLKNLTEFQQLAIVNNLGGANLVIIEPSQSGYMVNLLNVREIEFTKNMSNTESIYRITGSKLMKPKKATNYREVNLNNQSGNLLGGMVSVLRAVTVNEIKTEGFLKTSDGTDIRYFWFSDEPLPDLKQEIGKCRIETGQDFYITQTGGSSHKMQMPSLSGVPFPNKVIKFSGQSTERVTGRMLDVGYVVMPNLLTGTKTWSGTWTNSNRWYNNGAYRGMTIKSISGTANYGMYQEFSIQSSGDYTFSAFIKTSGVDGEIVFQTRGTGGTAIREVLNNTTFKRHSITRTLRQGDIVWCYVRLPNSGVLKKDAISFAGYKLEKNSEATDWVE